jgi:pilus assembly protein CpaE
MKINVLLVSKLDRTLNAMRSMINDEEITVIGDSQGGSQALDKIENISPDIIVMSLGSGDLDVLNLTERIILHKPRCFVILLLEEMNVDLMQKAIGSGAHNIIEFYRPERICRIHQNCL